MRSRHEYLFGERHGGVLTVNSISRKATALACLLALAAISPGLRAHSDIQLQIVQLDARIEAEGPQAELLLKRGDLYRRHGEFGAAQRDFEQARALDPDNEMLDLFEGRLLLDSGDAKAAEQALTRYLDRQPQHAKAWMLLGEANVANGDAITAAEHFRYAIRYSESPSPAIYRAQILATLAIGPEAWDSAEKAVEQGLSLFGTEVTLLGLGTDLALARARPEQAWRYLDRLPAGLERLPQWKERLAQAECLSSGTKDVGTACSEAALQKLSDQVSAFMAAS